MDFLTPLFAAIGLAAASIPVVLHMLRRAPTQDMPFSVVRFLKASQPKLTKRSNIEHWPLMLLRILALVLIGLAFARPFLRQVIPLDSPEGAVRAVTILVDQSASMRRDGIYEKVQTIIRDAIDELGDQDQLSVIAFSNTSRTLLTREQWATATGDDRAALADGVLTAYEPNWMATNTGAAMQMAAEDLAQEFPADSNVTERQLILITDFQRGSSLNELKTAAWPSNVEVQLTTVEPSAKGNAGVTFVADRRTDRTRVRISSAGDSVQQEFRLQPFDVGGHPVGEAVNVAVSPGQRRTVVLPSADEGQVLAGVELLGDEHPFDNVIDLPESENPVVKVAHIGPSAINDPESMRYYLQRVLSGNDERDVRLIDLMKADGVVLPIPTDVNLVVATAAIPESLLDSLKQFLDRSGTLLFAAPSADAVRSLSSVLPKNFEVNEAVVDDYAMLGFIDFEHPMFSTFSDARFADFSSIRFWQHRNLVFSEEDRKPGDWSVVAKFDSGVPAIVDVGAGDNGRLIVFASGWHPTDSQLALSTRFPPLITRILSLASPAQKNQLVQNVGDIIRPGEILASDKWSVTFPDGDSRTAAEIVNADSSDLRSATLLLESPGRYELTGQADDEVVSISLIAGLAASESRTEMLPVGQLQVLGIGVQAAPENALVGEDEVDQDTAKKQLSALELEKRQQWWRWFLLAGLACLVLESLWAAAIERRTVPV